jgi:ATP-dependent Lon protease
MEELFEGAGASPRGVDRRAVRSTGMEPTTLEPAGQVAPARRMIPFVENNYNVCELGPRGTGKSHIYKEVSPNSILISGGQTTVANLFYNLARRRSAWSECGTWWPSTRSPDLDSRTRWRPDHEGLHGLGVLRARQGLDPRLRQHGLRRQHRQRQDPGQDQPPAGALPGELDDRLGLLRPLPRLHPRLGDPKMRPEFFTNQYGFIVDYWPSSSARCASATSAMPSTSTSSSGAT